MTQTTRQLKGKTMLEPFITEAYRSDVHEIVSVTNLSDSDTSRYIVRSKSRSFLVKGLICNPRVGQKVSFKFDVDNNIVGWVYYGKYSDVHYI
jgi:hypothetical protein